MWIAQGEIEGEMESMMGGMKRDRRRSVSLPRRGWRIVGERSRGRRGVYRNVALR
jgi:hypothetical protein